MHVFIAYPFTNLIDEDTNTISIQKRDFLEKLRNYIITKGHTVFLAHYRENWGKDIMSAEECTPADFEEMLNADLIIAFPGEKIPSGGVMVELGWASAFKKRVILFLNKETKYSPLIYGLHTLSEVKMVGYDIEINMDTVIENISDEV